MMSSALLLVAPVTAFTPATNAEFTYFFSLSNARSQQFSANDLVDVYNSFGKDVKMNFHPYVKGNVTNTVCYPVCTREFESMCAIAVAQADDQGSQFPGQDASLQYISCMAVSGPSSVHSCCTAANINYSAVDECLTTPDRMQGLIRENLMAAHDLDGQPPVVQVGDNQPEYGVHTEQIKTELCTQYPTLSACGDGLEERHPQPVLVATPTVNAEFTYFYSMSEDWSLKFSAKDLVDVYNSFGNEVKMNLHPYVKGNVTNTACYYTCTLEFTSMCAIAVAQSDDQGSRFPGQEASVQWHSCMAVHGPEGVDECCTAAKISKSAVDECLATSDRIQTLTRENLKAAYDLYGYPPVVQVGDNQPEEYRDSEQIKTELCAKYPTLSACGDGVEESLMI